MNYKEIQKKESAPSRPTQAFTRSEYGERAVKNAKTCAPFMYGKVLNIGCGDGLETEALIDMGLNVTGLDLSDDKVEIAIENGVNAIVGRMEALPFKDKEFDCIYCAHTLEHAEDIDKAISEMQRVASRLVIIVPIEETTTNPAHTSVITSPDMLKDKIEGRITVEVLMPNIEREYLIVVNNAD